MFTAICIAGNEDTIYINIPKTQHDRCNFLFSDLVKDLPDLLYSCL